MRGSELRKGRSTSCGCKQKVDHSGEIINNIEIINKGIDNPKKYLCKCPNCGNTFEAYYGHIHSGATRSCGCWKSKRNAVSKPKTLGHIKPTYRNLIGEQFGLLKVIQEGKYNHNGRYWICSCQCGGITEVLGKHLKSGAIISCGCYHQSKGEEKIARLLQEHNLTFIREYSFNDLIYPKTQGKPRFDFFVNEQYIIEFDGRQHFQTGTWNATDSELKQSQYRDNFKNQYCFEHNIPIIRIPYFHYKEITFSDLVPETSSFLLERK